jgi:hypothetical protein
LWENSKSKVYLDEAIRAYARGFALENDIASGLDYAFMLSIRANLMSGDDSIADRVLAFRVRQEVLALCDEELLSGGGSSMSDIDGEHLFRLHRGRAEALIGLGRRADARGALEQASAAFRNPNHWMIASTVEQLEQLDQLVKGSDLRQKG